MLEVEGAVNWELALESVGNDEDLLAELVSAFLDESSVLMLQIHQALSEQDARVLERSAHTLKGSLQYFGCDQASVLAAALEEIGRNQKLDQAATQLAAFDQQMERVRQSLLQYIERNKSSE
jgi:HPt (histidine-containing phosphotransfer) domain-containing protein